MRWKRKNARIAALALSVSLVMPEIAGNIPGMQGPLLRVEASQVKTGSNAIEATGAVAAAYQASAADFEVDAEGVLTKYKGNAQAVIIPADLGITKIGVQAFMSKEMTKVVIPEGTTAIGQQAFVGCLKLKEIDFPETLTQIDLTAFQDCMALETLILPEGLESLGEDSFYRCMNLKKVSFPGTLKEIGRGAFRDTRLERVVLPEGLEKIGSEAFAISPQLNMKEEYRFSSCLTYIEIPDTVTDIEAGAFERCIRLKEVELPSGLTKVSDSLFYGCTALRRIEIPETVTAIGTYAFHSCSSLSEVNFRDIENSQLRSVYSFAFVGTAISDITFPESLEGFSGTLPNGDNGQVTPPDESDNAGEVLKLSAEASKRILKSFNPTNDTRGDMILNMVSNEIKKITADGVYDIVYTGKDVLSSWEKEPVITAATDEKDGSITGVLILKLAGREEEVPVNLIISKLDSGGETKPDPGEETKPDPGNETKPNHGGSGSNDHDNSDSSYEKKQKVDSDSGSWMQEHGGWKYLMPDGSYLKQQWKCIPWNGKTEWYYFDEKSMLLTGWYWDGRNWYYLHPLNDGNYGYMYTGWRQIGEEWYYFYPNPGAPLGSVAVNTYTPDGFRVDSNGKRTE